MVREEADAIGFLCPPPLGARQPGPAAQARTRDVPFGPSEVRVILESCLQASMFLMTASSRPDRCLWPSFSRACAGEQVAGPRVGAYDASAQVSRLLTWRPYGRPPLALMAAKETEGGATNHWWHLLQLQRVGR